MSGRGEAALMAQRALVERHVMTRLFDALLDLFFRFDRAIFGAHQAEHDHLALGREAQRREIAGAFIVIFKEETVDLHLVQQNLGDRLIAALRDPGAFEIAAAEMDGDRHVLWPIADRIIDETTIEMGQRIGIIAARLGRFADRRIAEIGKVGVVELKVAAAALSEISDLVAVRGGEIVVASLELGIGALADRLAAAAEVQHRRRRDTDFRGLTRRRFEKIEVAALDRGRVADFGFDMHGWRTKADLGSIVLTEFGGEFAVSHGDAVELFEEVDMKIRTAEFAVGNPLQADVLLLANHFAYAIVLDPPEVVGGKPASEKGFARLA